MKKYTTRPALLFALIASLGVSTPTYAIFGVGDIVFDPSLHLYDFVLSTPVA